MRAEHLVFFVEELSMAKFLEAWLPRALPAGCGFHTKVFRGKRNLLKRLTHELAAYSGSLPREKRIVVVVDCDEDDCVRLKDRLEDSCDKARLLSRRSSGTACWQVVTIIVVKELETWYFGDWDAVVKAFPRVPKSVRQKAAYRSPDAIGGKASDRFVNILENSRYGPRETGKVMVAGAIGSHIDPRRSTSASFRRLAGAIEEACGKGG